MLKYAAPKRANKPADAAKFFHRHLDHGFYGWVVLASLHAPCDFYLKLGAEPEHVLRLAHGDVLVFDASRDSAVVHGVDAVYRADASPLACRVSVQWRVRVPEMYERVKRAWIAKNLAEFPREALTRAFEVCGASRAGEGTQLEQVQCLVSLAAASEALAVVLFEYVRSVCEAPENVKKFLAKRLMGTGIRPQFECARHVDTDVTVKGDVWCHDRVAVPAYPGAPGTPRRSGPPNSRAFIRLS